jgi:sialate O-acetylesterase
LKILIAILLLLSIHPATAGLWMPSIFGPGMVLQADKTVPVWGEAGAGNEVTVQFAEQHKVTAADASGRWKVVLDPMPVSNQTRSLTVTTTGDSAASLQFADVLVGEVWIVAGQSNMFLPLKIITGGSKAAQTADYPWLRIFSQARLEGASDEPARDVTNGAWAVCNPTTAREMSAVGFHFARMLRTKIPDTPIAIIQTPTGATWASCWVDRDTLEKTPAAAFSLQYAQDALSRPAAAGIERKGPLGPSNYRRPAALFNGKVAPLQPLAVRGIIWYQGESDARPGFKEGYAGTLRALIESWRRGFGNAALPFLVVQLPRWEPKQPEDDWPSIRAAQAQVAREMPGVELAVMIDLGEQKEIHPNDKQPVGERLALLASAKVYGQSTACSGPVLAKAVRQDSAAILHFDKGRGLHFVNGTAKGFEIAGADGNFVPAQAEILSDGTIKVFHPGTTQPTAVRYAWFNWGDVSLYNADDLPAAPFAADL